MNVDNALSRHHNAALGARSRSRKTRERKGPNATLGKNWFPSVDAVRDQDLQEVVARRFRSMSEAHDRIRTKLLAADR